MDPYFTGRILALLLVAGVLSALDFRRNGRQSTAWQEYGLIILAGVLGAVVGAANDSITSGISPEYFIYGKGLTQGPHLRLDAIRYGAQVGFSGGGVAGALLVYLGRRKSKTPPLLCGFLLRQLWMPAAGAILGGFALYLTEPRLDPFHLVDQTKSVVPAERFPAFLRVWWIHCGVYAGLLLGVSVIVARIQKCRRQGLV
jgi:hypothetical protein